MLCPCFKYYKYSAESLKPPMVLLTFDIGGPCFAMWLGSTIFNPSRSVPYTISIDFVYQSIYLFMYPSIYLSIHPSIYLTIYLSIQNLVQDLDIFWIFKNCINSAGFDRTLWTLRGLFKVHGHLGTTSYFSEPFRDGSFFLKLFVFV